MNTLTRELAAYTEFTFRVIDHGGNRWLIAVEFKVLAFDFATAITSASTFAREHKLVPNHFTLSWRFDRNSLNSFIFTGEPK
jgi:hypothetical protein